MLHVLENIAKVFGVGPNANGWTYSWWSGFGSCLAYFGALGVALRHLNCGAKGCWRLGRHPVAGGKFRVCHRHHPSARITGHSVPIETIQQEHRDWVG